MRKHISKLFVFGGQLPHFFDAQGIKVVAILLEKLHSLKMSESGTAMNKWTVAMFTIAALVQIGAFSNKQRERYERKREEEKEKERAQLADAESKKRGQCES